MRQIAPREALAGRIRRLSLSLPLSLFLSLSPGMALPIVLCVLAAPHAGAQPSPWPDPGAVPPPPEMAADAARSSGRERGPRARNPGTWNVLTLIYRNMDATSGASRWETAMSDAQVAMLQSACGNFGEIVSQWSAGRGQVVNTVRVIERPLSTLTPVFTDFFWVTPDDVAAELEPELSAGGYDSVIVMWDSGLAPTNYWGLAYVGPINWRGFPFTWSTVIRGQDFWWGGAAPGEVILHEWLHGLEGHFRGQSYVVPELHGAEEHNYQEDPGGGWRTWLNDYMQGKVLESGRTTGISPAVWASGAVNHPVRPAPCQLLGPLDGSEAPSPPTLAWAGPDASFRVRLTNLADNSPAYEIVTSERWTTPIQHVLRTGSPYRWQVVAQAGGQDGGQESAALEAKAFLYSGDGIAYTISQAASALRVAAGLSPATVNAMGRLNLETAGPSAGRVDLIDTARIIRKVAGLDPNP